MRIFRLLIPALLATLCSGPHAQEESGGVSFRISEVSNSTVGDAREYVWLATHETKSAKAQFLISIQLKQVQGGSLFAFSKGYFARVPGSQSSELLKQLAVALAANKPRLSESKVQKLPFDFAILGTGLTRESGGGFSSKPAGSWIATKVFLAKGEGEVFLNIDPRASIGEFSIKDEDYGNIVVFELSKVL